jgi:hypothetical protein
MAIHILLFCNNSHILNGIQKKILRYIIIIILKTKLNKINKLVGGRPPTGVAGHPLFTGGGRSHPQVGSKGGRGHPRRELGVPAPVALGLVAPL